MQRSRQTLVSDLRRMVRGEVVDDAAALSEVSRDFGGLVHRVPEVAVRPLHASDVSRIVRYAACRGISVSTRAAGHSQGGQSLSEGGILLDTRGLVGIEALATDDPSVLAGAGMVWWGVVEAALGYGLVPPVLTNNLTVTLGGTHSTGGIGTSSFRYGSQADNCLALEVVTGSGEILWCSSEEEPELFRHALCGLGQFGIITRVKHRLRAHKPRVRTDVLLYDNLGDLLADLEYMSVEQPADYLEASAVRGPDGRSWLFPLRVTREVEGPSAPPLELDLWRLPRRIGETEESFRRFVLAPEGLRDLPQETLTMRPWMDALLPWAGARAYVEETLREMPETARCAYAFRPIRTRQPRTPMLILPDGETCLGFSVLPVVSGEEIAATLAAVSKASDRLTAGRGKRYLSGWHRFDARRWRSHYGDYWEKVSEMKRRYDPNGILNANVTRCEETGGEDDDPCRD